MPLYSLGEMISQFRGHLQAFETDLLFRPGDSADPRNAEDPESSISITFLLNEALTRIARATGYNSALVPLSVVSGTREYNIPANSGIVLAVYSPFRLRPTTVGLLNSRDYQWRTRAGGSMTQYYTIGLSRIGFVNPPTFDGSVDLLSIPAPTPLEDLADTPTGLPGLWGGLPAYEAALQAVLLDASNPSNQGRVAGLEKIVQRELDSLRQAVGVMEDAAADSSRDDPSPDSRERRGS